MIEQIQQNAELVRSVARQQLSVDVGYDRAGVEWLAVRGKWGQTHSGQWIFKVNRLPSKGSDPIYHGLLDGFVTRQHEQGDPNNVKGLANTLGSFFGECIVQTYGGEWSEDENGWCVQFNEKNAVYPFAKTAKHLRNGPEDSVLSMFDTIPLVFKDIGL
ncbi:MAG: hypothetical protein JSS49_17850 [Planctomycetes bacterium]|nr:hypothetical protein [Planctomycetota bacterium]